MYVGDAVVEREVSPEFSDVAVELFCGDGIVCVEVDVTVEDSPVVVVGYAFELHSVVVEYPLVGSEREGGLV